MCGQAAPLGGGLFVGHPAIDLMVTCRHGNRSARSQPCGQHAMQHAGDSLTLYWHFDGSLTTEMFALLHGSQVTSISVLRLAGAQPPRSVPARHRPSQAGPRTA